MPGRRSTLAAVAAVVALATASACGGDNQATGPAPAPSATPTSLSQVSLWVYGPSQVVTAYTEIARNFTHDHPETVVNVSPFGSVDAARTALTKAIAEGDPPDAFLAPAQDVSSLVASGAVQRLDDLLGKREVDFGDGFQRIALEEFSLDNALQCMPVDVSPLVVYYNTDLVDLSQLTDPDDPPIVAADGWNLEQFAEAARLASSDRARGLYVAPTLEQVAPFVLAGGGSVVDNVVNPTTLRLSDGSSVSALEQLLEIVRNPQLTYDQAQIAATPALERFEAGQLGMILGYRDLTPRLRASGVSFGVMPLPADGTRATVGQGSGLCLSSTSNHVDQAADFIAYVASKNGSSVLAETGFVVPTNLDAEHSDAFLQPGRQPVDAAVFSSNVRYIQPLPTVPAWTKAAAAAAPELTDLFYDPVIDPLRARLEAIDKDSLDRFAAPLTTTPAP
ncbi:MAG: hypothetical protein JWQ74_2112 [Marmoricola sp.]|nr:hypothetical protein [Marmoricola sp.]